MESETLKLYRVYVRGGHSDLGTDYHETYVVAKSLNDAYEQVRKFLDDNNLCFSDERELDKIELVAENTRYPECKKMLFIQEQN